MLKIVTVAFFLLLSACTMVGPDFKEPPTSVAPHWINSNRTAVKERPLDDVNWWNTFHDATLTSLIYQSYHNNLSLQIVGVRVLQARAQLAQSVGELYPQQQGMSGDYNYQRIGGNVLNGILPSSFYTAQLGFSSSWEIDFWGKYRRAIQANDATFASSLAAYDNSLVTLTSDVAKAYTSIRTIEQQIRVTKVNIKLQFDSLHIATARYQAGQTSLLDVQQAQTELSSTQAQLPTLLANLAHQKDALAVLLGVTPDQVTKLVPGKQSIPKAAANVAVAIPREVLCQRPDVHQARLNAAAESAKIGAIKANLYPALSLSGTFAFAANTIGNSSINDIFQWSNRTVTAGPGIAMPLFNYGQITNAVRIQDAAFQQALLNYQNVVLQAQQEVQDNISSYIQAQQAQKFLTVANSSAIKTTKLAIIRYREGEADYTTVLDAERQQLQVQLSLTSATGDIAQALIALYRSLGGGWQIRGFNDIVPNHIKAEMAARTNWGNLLTQPQHQPPTTKWQQTQQLYLPTW